MYETEKRRSGSRFLIKHSAHQLILRLVDEFLHRLKGRMNQTAIEHCQLGVVTSVAYGSNSLLRICAHSRYAIPRK